MSNRVRHPRTCTFTDDEWEFLYVLGGDSASRGISEAIRALIEDYDHVPAGISSRMAAAIVTAHKDSK